MEYKGQLFGKIGRKYIPLDQDTTDIFILESKLKKLQEDKSFILNISPGPGKPDWNYYVKAKDKGEAETIFKSQYGNGHTIQVSVDMINVFATRDLKTPKLKHMTTEETLTSYVKK